LPRDDVSVGGGGAASLCEGFQVGGGGLRGLSGRLSGGPDSGGPGIDASVASRCSILSEPLQVKSTTFSLSVVLYRLQSICKRKCKIPYKPYGPQDCTDCFLICQPDTSICCKIMETRVSASHGEPVYTPAFTGTHCAYPWRMARLS